MSWTRSWIGRRRFPISDTTLLPPPRSSLQTQGTVAYHLHLNYLPTAAGFFQVAKCPRHDIDTQLELDRQHRNTTDYSFNFGLNPTVHLGTNVLTFNAGIQGTIRRDSISRPALNQNLFRFYTYMTTSSFFNAVSVSGFVIRESGPVYRDRTCIRGHWLAAWTSASGSRGAKLRW